jgi:hypothetical protein
MINWHFFGVAASSRPILTYDGSKFLHSYIFFKKFASVPNPVSIPSGLLEVIDLGEKVPV